MLSITVGQFLKRTFILLLGAALTWSLFGLFWLAMARIGPVAQYENVHPAFAAIGGCMALFAGVASTVLIVAYIGNRCRTGIGAIDA